MESSTGDDFSFSPRVQRSPKAPADTSIMYSVVNAHER